MKLSSNIILQLIQCTYIFYHEKIWFKMVKIHKSTAWHEVRWPHKEEKRVKGEWILGLIHLPVCNILNTDILQTLICPPYKTSEREIWIRTKELLSFLF